MMTYVMVEEILDFNMDVAQLTNDEKVTVGSLFIWQQCGMEEGGEGGEASQKEDFKKRKLLIR